MREGISFFRPKLWKSVYLAQFSTFNAQTARHRSQQAVSCITRGFIVRFHESGFLVFFSRIATLKKLDV